jgi:sec-independent protein translocase protein TatB
VFDIGTGEVIALAVIALLVLGPEKLPRYAAEAARFLRQLRNLANDARSEVTRELGPELDGLDLRELNPRSLMRKHLLDGFDGLDDDEDDDRPAPRERRQPRTNRDTSTTTDAPFDPDTT